jgi:hypothetical protein
MVFSFEEAGEHRTSNVLAKIGCREGMGEM